MLSKMFEKFDRAKRKGENVLDKANIHTLVWSQYEKYMKEQHQFSQMIKTKLDTLEEENEPVWEYNENIWIEKVIEKILSWNEKF